MIQPRTSRGVPSGGQFAEHTHAEADISLTEPRRPSGPMTKAEADMIAYQPENIEAWGSLDDAPGEIIDDPSTLEAGSFVYVKGHGKIRKAVVYKVGKKNATARYTTPGACAEAEKIADHVVSSYRMREKIGDEVAGQAGGNYDFWVKASSPDFEGYERSAQRWIDEGIERAQANLAAAGSREEYASAARAARIAHIEESYRRFQDHGPAAFTTMTNATVKPGQAKLAPNR